MVERPRRKYPDIYIKNQENTNQKIDNLLSSMSHHDLDIEYRESALRVLTFLKEENSKTTGKNWNKHLQKIEDWKLYFDISNKWHGMNRSEIAKEDQFGGRAFYQAFNEWINIKTKDIKENIYRKVEDEKYRNMVLPQSKVKYSRTGARFNLENLYQNGTISL